MPPAFVHSNKLKEYVGPPADPVPEDYVEYLEIGAFLEKKESYCKAVNLSDEDLDEWLRPTSTLPFEKFVLGQAPRKVLRLVICSLPCRKFPHQPFTKDEFYQMRDVYNLKEDFFQTGELCGPNLWFETVVSDGCHGYVVQVDKFNTAKAAFKMSLCYDPASRITCAVVRVLVNLELDQLRSRLEALKHYMWLPVMLPLIIAETRVVSTPEKLNEDKDGITLLEKDAGVYKNTYFKDTLNPETVAPSEAREFDLIINGIIPIKSRCDYLLIKTKMCLEFLDFLDNVSKSYKADHVLKNRFGDFEQRCQAVCSSKIAYQQVFATNVQTRCRYVLDRAASLTSQCYTMMGQKDNYLNLRTANVSLKIAEMSREDNLQMKKIAESTARDSTDMRSIAMLTMIYLPPTFTATFFSTSFFDFSPRNEKLVSWWYWVYWVVTCALVICTLGLWYVQVKWGLMFWKRKANGKAAEDTEKHAIVPKSP
ncbi:hypothetical protein, variant [Verruconis gallopava]|uniref:Uncharacterized protein n=1 Tax=Verruconis gallopava TaxID=253628 RepID=A0A0D1XPB7_9PEZI|nr:hypothetical protein, variant [Verruconis gallopava]KIW04406.1 hypothetical protein, variant [Verruconis gallopava]